MGDDTPRGSSQSTPATTAGFARPTDGQEEPDRAAFVSCPSCSTLWPRQGCAAADIEESDTWQCFAGRASRCRSRPDDGRFSYRIQRQTVTGRFPVWASASRPAQPRRWSGGGRPSDAGPQRACPDWGSLAWHRRPEEEAPEGCGALVPCAWGLVVGGGGAAEGGDPSFDPGIHGPR